MSKRAVGAANGNWQGGKNRDRKERGERYVDPYYEEFANKLRERAQALIEDGYLSSDYSRGCWNLHLVEKVVQAAENIKAASLQDGVNTILRRLSTLRNQYPQVFPHQQDEVRLEMIELTNYLQRIGVSVDGEG